MNGAMLGRERRPEFCLSCIYAIFMIALSYMYQALVAIVALLVAKIDTRLKDLCRRDLSVKILTQHSACYIPVESLSGSLVPQIFPPSHGVIVKLANAGDWLGTKMTPGGSRKKSKTTVEDLTPLERLSPYKQHWEFPEVTKFAWIFHHAILRQRVHFPISMRRSGYSSLPLHGLLMPAFLHLESRYAGLLDQLFNSSFMPFSFSRDVCLEGSSIQPTGRS